MMGSRGLQIRDGGVGKCGFHRYMMGGVGGYRYMMGRWGVRVLQIHDGE